MSKQSENSNNPCEDWIKEKNLALALRAEAMTNDQGAVNNVKRFCLIETARRVVAPFKTNAAHCWEPHVARFVATLSLQQAETIGHYFEEVVKELANLPTTAAERIGGNEKGLVQKLAVMLSCTLSPTTRTLNRGEILSLIWAEPIPWTLEMVKLTDDMLIPWPANASSRVVDGKEAWKKILRTHGILTDENLAQAHAWAINAGFAILKVLPKEQREGLVKCESTHRDAVVTVKSRKKSNSSASGAAGNPAPQ